MENVQNPINPETENTQKIEEVQEMPKKSNFLKVLFFILLAGAFMCLGALGYWFYQTKTINRPEPSPEASVSPSPEQSTSPEVSFYPGVSPQPQIPADWRTYTNTEYRFELKYPKDYILSGYLKIQTEDLDPNYGISLIKEKNKNIGQPPTIKLNIVRTAKSAQEFINYEYDKELSSWKEIKESRGLEIDKPEIVYIQDTSNNHITAKKTEIQRTPIAPNSKETQYLFKQGDLLYILSVNYGTFNPDTNEDGTDEKNALSSIFSSFKFIN